jgi:AraC family transcriptional regulator
LELDEKSPFLLPTFHHLKGRVFQKGAPVPESCYSFSMPRQALLRRSSEPPQNFSPAAADLIRLPSVEVFQKVLGAARSVYSWEDFNVCLWDVRELDQYDLPATTELVVNLHTGGLPVRSRLASGWTRDISPGHVHVMPPSVATTWKAGRELVFLSIHFPVSRIEGLTENSSQSRRWIEELRLRVGVQDPLVAAAATALAREVREPGERTTLFAEHLADTILLQVLRTRRGAEAEAHREWRGGLSSRAMRIARDKIESGLASGVTLPDLAREVGLTRAHFARAFKVSMGMPPHQFMTSRRVERAKELLLRTDHSLAEIALEVGFSSQAHFTDQFRRATGSTPHRYRKGTDPSSSSEAQDDVGALTGTVATGLASEPGNL